MIPVSRRPASPANVPSANEASGLLPAQAIAHTAITGATRAGPAAADSRVRVIELASRAVTPAPTAAARLTTIHGVATNSTMQTPRAASRVAASLSVGWCRE